MPSLSPSRDKQRRRRRVVAGVLTIAVLLAAYSLWAALRVGPPAEIAITTDRPAIGPATQVTVTFAEPQHGLGVVKLELLQGERTLVLAQEELPRTSPFVPLARAATPETSLQATVGHDLQGWLSEGEATLRASADRFAGPLRSPAPVVLEKRLAVRLRPPRLEVISRQHYVRQGGAGAVVFRTGSTAARSGVQAGEAEFLAYPLPGGKLGEQFALFAVPWSIEDSSDIRLFAEDDAGNEANTSFVDGFNRRRRRADRIHVSDDFLERVVPAIVANTPGLAANGTLLEQYLTINGQLRAANLAEVVELSSRSEPRFLWAGAFLQMPNSQLRAGFAEPRTYLYEGREVDRQTHLGIDIASTSRAPVPAPNAGRVLHADWLGIYGNAVVLDHGFGLTSLCGHLSEISVSVGDRVEKGEKLGSSGATGLAGGDHVHLEIFLQGTSVDPIEWLDGNWIRNALGTKLLLPSES